MKGKSSSYPVRHAKDAYRVRKAVMNGIPMADVDMEHLEGGFAWAALLPVLKAIGMPIVGALGSWVGKKIFGPRTAKAPPGYIKDPAGPEGSGILRAGDRRGKGILQAGASRGGGQAGDIPMTTLPKSRNGKITSAQIERRSIRAGDIPMTSKFALRGGAVDAAKLRAKLIPFIKANDPEGFKAKILKAIKKKGVMTA